MRRDDKDESEYGEKFGDDLGYGQEGEQAAPVEGPVDEGAKFLDYYEEPRMTELAETESPFDDEIPPDLTRSDKEISHEVQERLDESRRVDVSGIEIAVHEGVVSLSGLVHTEEEIERAEDVASTVLGVRVVKNSLKVEN